MNTTAIRRSIPFAQLPPVRTDPPAFARWRDYPAGIGGYNAIITSDSLSTRLSRLSSKLFSEVINLHIIDINDIRGSTTCATTLYERAAEVESILCQPDEQLPRVRIISLHSAKSLGPLQISESLMRKVLTRYEVDPAFLSVLYSFGGAPHLAENGSSNETSRTIEEGSHNLIYQIRYSEENQRSRDSPWSVRQTGVYHHHSSTKKFDLFIILHPLNESVLERRLLEFGLPQSDARGLTSIFENPYRLHILPFASYLENWRWYFRSLGKEFQKKNDEIMTLDLETLQLGTPAAVTQNFDKMLGLRDLQDTSLSLSAHCKSSLEIIEKFQEIPSADFQGVWSLNSYKTQLVGYVENMSVLTKRIGNTIDLFAYALDLKNQSTAADTNNHVSQLAETTTRDTAAVKWITYLTLLYLPGSFVASIYGMNLFVFNQQTMKIMIADDFWICIATWIPLTLLTFLCYGLLVLRHKDRAENGWHWLNTSKSSTLKGP
ncbi:hypothetical protein JMJ35_002165 [Cladonia borealis]|uniref:CorA-like transporter domain-containing protein n=1 Tax=Cladonia borealis TaxID=184061 RepID=A0AA39R648_9LECA|nr:hypothetical protein JMJ35_002165 [Cladonia borealis]